MSYINTTKSQNRFAEMIVQGWLDYQLQLHPENIYIKKALDLLIKPLPEGYGKHISVTLHRSNIVISICTPDCSDILLFIGYYTYNPNKTEVRLKENNFTGTPVLKQVL